ncbi:MULTISPECIES: DUF2304 domain-containing protein [unclassified Microbacterium]|uniref:DUF2304 domain-containing protein n=1 Tax=unclassified Microbacterium TaxID=2609290 RepID=UPI0004936989|nr:MULTISPECIES: DUF2304 domain-containing protein [unclassified Microbacterium]MCV0333165.1 DUF2304 domain-containing protein [Microbacterium sp.]MCV0375610.1 DUF2304 domain-containing protein [Microbacterium sp.]MCV0389035.1 DUF2304 domain-containing protein [Microbacterium sp.]MCV0417563.1 DUF2304 domain-containing protein [Microbacterium sp.]MCV0420874.1 DUF2304 domain-containing protein [Microbacterium sp.]
MIVYVGIASALFILAIIVWMLLSKRLREKYAVLWLIIGVAMLILTVFPDLLFWLSNVLGVQVPSNLLFVGAIALLVGVTLHQSWELSTAEDETRRVAEEVAILRAEVDALRAEGATGGNQIRD